MKLLCEVPLSEVKSFERSKFDWLAKSNGDNLLFTLENEKRLRVFTLKQQNGQNPAGAAAAASAHEAQSASLAEPRRCTSLSWNRDESLLALVVDRRQIYFWEVRRNSFVQFKPKYLVQQQQQQQQHQQQEQPTGSNGSAALRGEILSAGGGRRKSSSKDIELIAWSKLSDKLAICFADGQILLCNVATIASASEPQAAQASYYSLWEHFVSNSDGVLKRIDSIQVSDQADLFACASVSAELLVMTFDGDNRLYCQGEGEGCRLSSLKFSPLAREYNARLGAYSTQSLWLAYRTDCEGGLFFRKLHAAGHAGGGGGPALPQLASEEAVSPSKLGLLLQDVASNPLEAAATHSGAVQSSLVDFFWLTATRLIACLSSGSVQLIQINTTSSANSSASYADAPLPAATKMSLDRNGTPSFSTTRLARSEVLRIGGGASATQNDEAAASGELAPSCPFRTFELERRLRSGGAKANSSNINKPWRQSFVLAAGTSDRLYYYEIYESRGVQLGARGAQFNFEQFDEVDLSEALARVQLQLVRLKWSQDCAMLAVQLTSGHLLVYQTQLQHGHMVASYASKTAYLSAPTEITLLNYGLEGDHQVQQRSSPLEAAACETPSDSASGRHSACSSRNQPAAPGGNAIILAVQFRPSLLAIGPRHLAVALNNRVRFYAIETIQQAQQASDEGARQRQRREFDEQEYVTLVVGIGLSSKFVAILLDDGRVKLHSLKQLMLERRLSDEGGEGEAANSTSSRAGDQTDEDDEDDDEMLNDERFIPDPTESSEKIVAFALTEQLLVYATRELRIYVFSLGAWRTTQACSHSKLFAAPIRALKANERGNKFACLPGDTTRAPLVSDDESDFDAGDDDDDDDAYEARVFLYDLFTNEVFALAGGSNGTGPLLIDRILRAQLARTLAELPIEAQQLAAAAAEQAGGEGARRRKRARDVVWDTDGRTILFIEAQFIHVFAVLEHTLAQEAPLALYADSARKASSYSTLYVSQGIASFQTRLGRVVNVILETHDDELKLTRLEQQIGALNEQQQQQQQLQGQDEAAREVEGHLRAMLLKLDYLRTILPIYSLPKCRDICEHLMEDAGFHYKPALGGASPPPAQAGQRASEWRRAIDRLLWRQLASWAVFTLNLQFAAQVYQEHEFAREHAQLEALFEEMRALGLDSRAEITRRLLALLQVDS